MNRLHLDQGLFFDDDTIQSNQLEAMVRRQNPEKLRSPRINHDWSGVILKC